LVFNDEYRVENCGNCDNCLNESNIVQVDVTEDAIRVICLVEEVKKARKPRLPVATAVMILCGSKDKRLEEVGLEHLVDEHKLPHKITLEACKSFVHFLILEDVLGQYIHYVTTMRDRYHWYLKLGPHANDVLEGKRRVIRPMFQS